LATLVHCLFVGCACWYVITFQCYASTLGSCLFAGRNTV